MYNVSVERCRHEIKIFLRSVLQTGHVGVFGGFMWFVLQSALHHMWASCLNQHFFSNLAKEVI